jgi:predicted metalloendopeptidase
MEPRRRLCEAALLVDGTAPLVKEASLGQALLVTVRNVPAFLFALQVKPDDKMYLPPNQRVRIW